MDGMKPCPFCGSPWVQVRWIGFKNAKPSEFHPGLYAECTDCFAMKGPYSEKEDAEYAWNRRADYISRISREAALATEETIFEYFEHDYI